MRLTYYAISQLQALGKAAVRALLPSVGTESGADMAIIPDTAALMFQGAQVAAAHIEEQLFPADASAETLQTKLELHGIDFTKEATKARGFIAIGNKDVNSYDKLVAKGTTFEFPGTAFVDGISRTFVAIEDGLFRPELDNWAPNTPAGHGNSNTKLRTRTEPMRRGDVVVFVGTSTTYGTGVVRRADATACVAEMFGPYEVDVVDGDTLVQGTKHLLVAVEAQDAGVEGNCTSIVIDPDTSNAPLVTCSDETLTDGWVIEMSGGGDAVGAIDGDTDRVIRTIEDTEAGAPSGGNPQHWRELAIACPDVDVDDAIVYMGVRGQGSIDVVCIGRKGQMRVTEFPSANVAHLAHGHNRRRIGELQAAKVEQWLNYLPDGTRRANYFDDVKCHSVEWDYRGTAPSHYSSVEFLRSANTAYVRVFAHPGYGPDLGDAITYIPHTQSLTKLYPTGVGAEVDSRFAVGQRVAVNLKSPASTTFPIASIVTTIIGIDAARKFVTIADLTPVAKALMAQGTDAEIMAWRTAGPLDQAIEDAYFGYFDDLGPGSYTTVPFDPGFQDAASATLRITHGVRIERWPDEGRRWPGSFRVSELRARINAIRGVHSMTITNLLAQPLMDFDPAPMQTLASSGLYLSVEPVT